MTRKTVVAGNWKSNGTLGSLRAWVEGFDPDAAEAILCVPHPYLALATELLAGKVQVGAQDVATHDGGARTGDTTAKMVADCGATVTLAGHSERRANGEDDKMVRMKLEQALGVGLRPILCIGESLEARKAGRLEQVLRAQVQGALSDTDIDELTVAYEPVWAIGTGVAATEEEAQEACALTRNLVVESLGGAKIKVLYGGSVNPGNAAGIVARPGIEGLLVGGASLEAESFSRICAVSSSAVRQA